MPLERNSAYIFGSLEERSKHFEGTAYEDITFIQLIDGEDGNTFQVSGRRDVLQKKILTFHGLLSELFQKHIYLDITGLPHSLWAPILKCLLEKDMPFKIIYAEPHQYSTSLSNDSVLFYDLSEKIHGVSPIPGFTRLHEESDNFLFVPMIGFEGTRFSFLVETVQPLGSNLYPLIGIPGFRAEYPFLTYSANKLPLKNTGAWRNLIYAAADCPFAAFLELEILMKKNPNTAIKIGPIGTKPHALGAILFTLAYPDLTEIIYDHPVRKEKSTKGILKKHIYDIRGFFKAGSVSLKHAGKSRLR